MGEGSEGHRCTSLPLGQRLEFHAFQQCQLLGRTDHRVQESRGLAKVWLKGEGSEIVQDRGVKGQVLTLPVGTYPHGISPYGLFDVTGNVSEWVADWYDPYYYLKGPPSDPEGPEHGILKSIRGGSWLKPASSLRLTYRDYGQPDSRLSGAGFRCAKDDR